MCMYMYVVYSLFFSEKIIFVYAWTERANSFKRIILYFFERII